MGQPNAFAAERGVSLQASSTPPPVELSSTPASPTTGGSSPASPAVLLPQAGANAAALAASTPDQPGRSAQVTNRQPASVDALQESAPVLPGQAGERTAQSRARLEATQPRPAREAELERAAEILKQFRAALGPGVQRATLELEPRELGRLTVRISLHAGRLRAALRARSPETLALLQQHLPELRAALESTGLRPHDIRLELDPAARLGGARPARARSARADAFETLA